MKTPINQTETIETSFGDRLRRLRIKEKFTQAELATRANISKGFLSDLEQDKTTPSAETLRKLAECLFVSMDFLWTGRGWRVVNRTSDK